MPTQEQSKADTPKVSDLSSRSLQGRLPSANLTVSTGTGPYQL